MKTEDFKQYIDLYSADLSRWPVDLVKAAVQLMEENDDMRHYFEQEVALDDSLRFGDPSLDISDLTALEMRILAAVENKMPDIPSHIQPPRIPKFRQVLVVAGMLGLIIGGFVFQFSGVMPDNVQTAAVELPYDFGGPDDFDFYVIPEIAVEEVDLPYDFGGPDDFDFYLIDETL